MRTKSVLIVFAVLTMLLVSVVPVLAATDTPTWHTVARGETLIAIGRRYNVDPWAIASANGITNLNRIYAGQRLRIPVTRVTGTVHIVRAGENLSSIAVRYKVDAWAIARANGITNLNHIYIGQRLTIPVTPAPAPAPAPSGPSLPAVFPGPWTGEYFDNITLSAPAWATRQDPSINFDWNSGPPAGGMPVNAFSVRWTGTFNLAGGTYRFYVRMDDGARVYVDGQLVIDGWRDGALRLLTADRALTAGNHTIQVEYYDRLQVARVYFWWQQLTTAAPPPPPPPASPAPTGAWFGQYYANSNLQEPPAATRTDASIGFEWGTGSPFPGMRSDFFSVRWTQTVFMNAGTYRFCAMSDDGVRLWVDGQPVLNEWHPSNGVSYCNSFTVAAGNHQVKVEYYEDGGNALIYVWWNPAQ